MLPNLEEKLFVIHDEMTRRIQRCCGKLDWTPGTGSCGTCRLDGQLRGALRRYMEAGNMRRPGFMSVPARLEIVQPLPRESEGSGLPPLSLEERAEFQRKLQGASARIDRREQMA